MTLADFISENDVDYSYNRVSEAFVNDMENELGLKIGVQLKNYILQYGYLGYKYIELYGVNNTQGMNSDMIKRTVLLNKSFEKTQKLIAVEDQGDGDYYMVDDTDRVYRFVAANNELVPQNVSLFDYILMRFLAAYEA